MTNTNIRKNLGLIEAGARVVGEHIDADDLGEALDNLAHLEVIVDRAKLLIVKAMRERGATWADVGRALGVTRQAAYLHYHEEVGQ